MAIHWTPSFLGKPVPGIKWRILKDHGTPPWYFIECKNENGGQWESGLAGTQEWLGLSDKECARAYEKK